MVCEEENQKEQDLTQEQEQLADIMSLFKTVSGIKLYLFPPQATLFQIKPCSFCHSDKSSDCINILIQLTENHTYCKSGLYLCPFGKFRICVPIYTKNHLSHMIISDPLSFSSKDDKAQTEGNNMDFNEHLLEHPVVPPSRLIKVARLLRHALGTVLPQKEREEIRQELLHAAEDGNITSARRFPEHFFLKTVAKNGTAFTSIKNNSLDLILTLEELTADTLQSELPKNSERIFSDWCRADTIGKLKECINLATEQFINAAFYPTLQKHTALIHEAILHIKQHYKSKLSEEHVASLVYVSPSYFSKIFKENVGYSFNEYVNHLRIEKAKNLLLRPELTLAQISSMVGYENRSYFGKIFKAKTGVTPAKYRQYHL